MTESGNKSDGNDPAGSDELVFPELGRLAGIDYGTVRIGVAISDPSRTIASPLEIYNRRSLTKDADYFRTLVKQERVVGFVVGLPVHMSGDESEKSREARAFGKWLVQETGIPVTWIDERYTTAMAREMLSHSNLSGKKRKAQLDKLAAQILLTTYLDSSGRNHGPGSLD